MSHTTRQADTDIVAVVHRTGGTWRGLVATTRTGQPRLIETRRFDADQALQAWVDGHQAAEVVCVLPAAAVVCRTAALPAAEPDQLEQALHLQAEAHSLTTAPAHRLAMAVLDAAPAETSRSGLILAWPENADAPMPSTAAPVRYAADVAALAALMDGYRPDDPLIWVDRSDGSVALAFSHANGAAFRATHEDLAAGEWATTVGRVLAETGLSVGHTGSFVEAAVTGTRQRLETVAPGEAHLLVPDEIRQAAAAKVTGVANDPQWWSENGILLGALLARQGMLAPLTRMRHSAPVEKPTPGVRIVSYLSRPGTAVRIGALAALAILLGPLATSWGRLQVLEWRHPDLDEKLESFQEAQLAADIYTTMGEQRWTMTKLLADLACCTPIGVEIDQVRITHGDVVSVTGTVRDSGGLNAREVAAMMQTMLNDSGVFQDAKYNVSSGTSFGQNELSMTADVIEPHMRSEFSLEQDFGKHTLRQRKQNEDPADDTWLWDKLALGEIGTRDPDPVRPATPSGAVASAEGRDGEDDLDADDADDETAEPPRVADAGGERARPDWDAGRSERGGERGLRSPGRELDAPRPRSQDIPPPLTQEQIDSMDETEVMAMWAKVANARNIAKGMKDDELIARLTAEFDMLKTRKIELSKSKGDD